MAKNLPANERKRKHVYSNFTKKWGTIDFHFQEFIIAHGKKVGFMIL
ncbi:MAG: hypothetical protein Q4B15_02175 [Lachnospiraceae bacterium]|nr:hypothetical protein [Lachnospiraceae bacterium]